MNAMVIGPKKGFKRLPFWGEQFSINNFNLFNLILIMYSMNEVAQIKIQGDKT